MKIIGIAGVAGAGKDTFYSLLSQRMFCKRASFADFLKKEVRPWCGDQYGIDPCTCSREEKEIITVIPTAITPPKKEANGKIEICIRIMGPISIKTIVAPKADPEAAPIRYGSARGFLNIA